VTLKPITLRQAAAFIEENHRHCGAPRGWKFGIALHDDRDELVGVVIVGRPVARLLADGLTAEIVRCCVREGVENGCSRLYGAARRAALAMGYRRIVTYTLASEPGASLRAAGFAEAARVKAESWDRANRRREAGDCLPKIRWEIAA